METLSALLAICAGNSPVPGVFPAQRPVTRSFDVSFDLRPNKRLSKQWWGWCFETPSSLLWRHCNETQIARNLGLPCQLSNHFAILHRAWQWYCHALYKNVKPIGQLRNKLWANQCSDFMRFGFKMRFGWIFCVTQPRPTEATRIWVKTFNRKPQWRISKRD